MVSHETILPHRSQLNMKLSSGNTDGERVEFRHRRLYGQQQR